MTADNLHREPTGPKEFWAPTNTSINLTFASVPLSLAGGQVKTLLSGDRDRRQTDQADIQNDVAFLSAARRPGFRSAGAGIENGHNANVEPDWSRASRRPGAHTNYVSHHDGAQYFGYLANNQQ